MIKNIIWIFVSIIGLFILIPLVGMLFVVGCEPIQRVSSQYYNSTNQAPSRFQMESSIRYCMDASTPDYTITVFNDTEGTNSFVVINNGNGICVLPINKSIKQAEDSWKK